MMDVFYELRNNNNNENKLIADILSEKIELNIVDEDGYNMLMVSIINNLELVSSFLIKKGIDLNHKNQNGQSALHILAYYYNKNILNEVLEQGIDVNLIDIYGNNSLWTAIINDKGFGTRYEMIKLLLEKNVDLNHINKAGKSPLVLTKNLGYSELHDLLVKHQIDSI